MRPVDICSGRDHRRLRVRLPRGRRPPDPRRLVRPFLLCARRRDRQSALEVRANEPISGAATVIGRRRLLLDVRGADVRTRTHDPRPGLRWHDGKYSPVVTDGQASGRSAGLGGRDALRRGGTRDVRRPSPDVRPECRAAEVHHAGGEHLRAAPASSSRSSPRSRRGRRCPDPASTRVPRGDATSSRRSRSRRPEARRLRGPSLGTATAPLTPVDDERPVRVAPVVPVDVLRADQRGFGPAEVAPALSAVERAAAPLDPVEEVVRGEEGEVAAEVAVALDQRRRRAP